MGVATLLMAATLAQTSLTITIWPEGRGASASQRWTLRCEPAGGTLPRAGSACRTLDTLGSGAFRPIPQDAACTLQYGGPEDAVVSGTFRGRRVWARFRRRDGCEIARWKRHETLFPIRVESGPR